MGTITSTMSFFTEGIAVVHFENFLYQESVGDLANFIRKMMEKITGMPGLAWI